MAAVSAPSFGKLIDVYANQGHVPVCPLFFRGQNQLRLWKSEDSPLDEIDAIFETVLLFRKSAASPPFFNRKASFPAATARDLRLD